MSTEPQPPTITISLNGKPTSVGVRTSVSELLQLKALRAALVAVEYNQNILQKEQFATTILAEDDQVEIVHFVGGG